MSKIIINGWIEEEEYDEILPSIDEIPIHEILNDKIDELDITSNNSLCYNEEDDRKISINKMINNVFMQIHVSDKEITLEEANNNFILMSLGQLDIYETWYGYSEWTIMGYDLQSFKLVGNDGEHDLNDIFLNYVGKYLILVVEIKD